MDRTQSMLSKNCFLVVLLITFLLSVQGDKVIEKKVNDLNGMFGSTSKPTAPKSTDNFADFDELIALVEKDQQKTQQVNAEQEKKMAEAGQDYVGDGLGTPKKVQGVPSKEAQDAMYYGTAIGFFALISTIFVCGCGIAMLVAFLKKRKRDIRKENAGELYHAMN